MKELERLQEAYQRVIEDTELETKLTTLTSIEQRIRVLKKKMADTHKYVKGGASDKAMKDDLKKQMKDLAETKQEIAALKKNEASQETTQRRESIVRARRSMQSNLEKMKSTDDPKKKKEYKDAADAARKRMKDMIDAL